MIPSAAGSVNVYCGGYGVLQFVDKPLQLLYRIQLLAFQLDFPEGFSHSLSLLGCRVLTCAFVGL